MLLIASTLETDSTNKPDSLPHPKHLVNIISSDIKKYTPHQTLQNGICGFTDPKKRQFWIPFKTKWFTKKMAQNGCTEQHY